MTFKQAQELKAHIRKGEKGHLVVKYSTFTRRRNRQGKLSLGKIEVYHGLVSSFCLISDFKPFWLYGIKHEYPSCFGELPLIWAFCITHTVPFHVFVYVMSCLIAHGLSKNKPKINAAQP